MKKFLAAASVFLLAGCTSVTTYHNACMEMAAPFARQVDCVKANVAQNASMSADTYVQEYLATGDDLVKQVQAGRLTEDRARLEFVKKLNDIKNDELEAEAHQAEISRANEPFFPEFGHCGRFGKSFSCYRY
jgi:hypothetical protein